MHLGPPLRREDKILVRIPSWLGDAVACEPALRALDEWRQRSHATGGLSIAGPAALLPLFDGTLPDARRIPHHDPKRPPLELWRGHTVALLFTGSFRSAWWAWRAGIPRRVGWARDGRALLLTDRMRPPLERGRPPLGVGTPGRGRRYLPRPLSASAVELVGLVQVLVADPCPRLAVAAAADVAVEARLERAGFGGEPFLLVNTGGRPGGAKTFPALRFHAVLAALLERAPLFAVVVAGPGEEESVRETIRGLPPERVLPWIDPVADLPGLVALAARARLVLTADSGPRHVAAAVGARVVALLGPSDPRHGAACTARTDLVRVDVPCGPCHRERCPLEPPDHHVCMRQIDLDELVALVLERLGPL